MLPTLRFHGGRPVGRLVLGAVVALASVLHVPGEALADTSQTPWDYFYVGTPAGAVHCAAGTTAIDTDPPGAPRNVIRVVAFSMARKDYLCVNPWPMAAKRISLTSTLYDGSGRLCDLVEQPIFSRTGEYAAMLDTFYDAAQSTCRLTSFKAEGTAGVYADGEWRLGNTMTAIRRNH